ncbi:MAG: FumA C-terminus/TtdB family hydratase beta subunit [bacterium]|jgi:fumarate hydratase subunit beta
MALTRRLSYPFSAEQIAPLQAGQFVLLSGELFTARDRMHKYLFEGGESPVDLKDGALYHCGPVVIRKESKWVVRAAGPTTSIREEPYLPRIINEHGVRVVIGKGSMGKTTEQACLDGGCVYLHAVGGAAQVLADRVIAVKEVYFGSEFGPAEAMWVLDVKDFPAIVAIDSRGKNLMKTVQATSRKIWQKLVASERFEA